MDVTLTDLIEPTLDWYEENKRRLPWRETKDPYRIWVSEIMLQQTRVEAVMDYYARFTERLPDVAALAACEDDELLKLWQGLGYYSRARHLKEAAIAIMRDHDGGMPRTYEEIRALSGIGDYTAGAICSIAYDLPIPAVDGNVLRILARVRGDARDILKEKTKKSVREDLLAVMPESRSGELNQAFMDIGATVCLPNGMPRCDACPYRAYCTARRKGRIGELPVRRKSAKRRIEARTIVVVWDGARVLLHKRPDKGLLAGLYEPLNLKGTMDENGVRDVLRKMGFDPLQIAPLSGAKHIFSHIEWHMTGFSVRVADAADYRGEEYILVDKERIRTDLSIPSAYAAYMGSLRED